MEVLNDYSGVLSVIAIVVSLIAIGVSVWISRQSSKQIDEIHKDWDRKRKFSGNYDAYSEFQDNVRRK